MCTSNNIYQHKKYDEQPAAQKQSFQQHASTVEISRFQHLTNRLASAIDCMGRIDWLTEYTDWLTGRIGWLYGEDWSINWVYWLFNWADWLIVWGGLID